MEKILINPEVKDKIVNIANIQYNLKINWDNITDIIINPEGFRIKFNKHDKYLVIYYKELV